MRRPGSSPAPGWCRSRPAAPTAPARRRATTRDWILSCRRTHDAGSDARSAPTAGWPPALRGELGHRQAMRAEQARQRPLDHHDARVGVHPDLGRQGGRAENDVTGLQGQGSLVLDDDAVPRDHEARQKLGVLQVCGMFRAMLHGDRRGLQAHHPSARAQPAGLQLQPGMLGQRTELARQNQLVQFTLVSGHLLRIERPEPGAKLRSASARRAGRAGGMVWRARGMLGTLCRTGRRRPAKRPCCRMGSTGVRDRSIARRRGGRVMEPLSPRRPHAGKTSPCRRLFARPRTSSTSETGTRRKRWP